MSPYSSRMNRHSNIPPAQWSHILSELRGIETRDNVRILFAVESGSRAWGFHSPDSDFDVRFVYARHPDWYLSLTPGRDVIELPLIGDDDINGWDIRKALELALKPNPVLLEWLSSPIKYLWREAICADIRTFTQTIAHEPRTRHHYMRMTEIQRGDSNDIKLKRYFYALRAAMALRWIETRTDLPPMNFQELMAGVEINANLTAEIMRLLDIKRSATELGTGPRIPLIEDFLSQQLAWGKSQPTPIVPADILTDNRTRGDALFRDILGAVWET